MKKHITIKVDNSNPRHVEVSAVVDGVDFSYTGKSEVEAVLTLRDIIINTPDQDPKNWEGVTELALNLEYENCVA